MSSKAAIKLMSRFFQGIDLLAFLLLLGFPAAVCAQEESPRVFIEGNVYGMLASSVPEDNHENTF